MSVRTSEAPAAAADGTGSGKRLLYIANIDFPSVRARSIQVVQTCHALTGLGWRVTLVVGQREAPPLGQYLGRYGLTETAGLAFVAVPAPRVPASAPRFLRDRYSRIWGLGFTAGVLARLPRLVGSERPDLLMVRDYRMAWTLLGLARVHHVPLVFEAHNLPSLEAEERAGGGDCREVRRLGRLERSVFERARLVVTITERLRARILERYRLTPDRVVCVPDASRDPTAAPAPEARAAGSGQPPTFVYAGQLYPWKGVDVLLRALPLVPTARLEIVGGMPEDAQRERLRGLADELGVGDRVELVGPVPYAEVPRYLARADGALLPLAKGAEAREFTSPLKLFDYLAAGVPVVAADFPTIREVVRDGENGLLFQPGDAASLAEALRRLDAEPELGGRLRQAALATARDFTWERRAQRLDSAFLAALRRST